MHKIFNKVTATVTLPFLHLKEHDDEFAFSVAEKVIEKLGSLAYEEISSAWGISSDLKSLSSPCPPSKPCCWMLRRSK
jgi:hypothetical protein